MRLSTLSLRLAALFALILLCNAGAWIWALVLFADRPVLLGTALLAYGFGLRHAVDADHIAAIDNVTRKLMQQGQRPVAVGFFFALGHSTVVALAVAGIAFTTAVLAMHIERFHEIGSVVGTLVSALFLFAIALANLAILRPIWRAIRGIRSGRHHPSAELEPLLANPGVLTRIVRPVFRLIGRSWHMYPLGFLFGLGFDTATEVSLLGISASQAAKGLEIWSIMVFPALFAAGMSLVDTADGVLMLGAYNWAFVSPLRKLYYNLTITSMSVAVAFVIGGIELLGLTASRFDLSGGVWRAIAVLNDNVNALGFSIIGLFAAAWAVSVLFSRYVRPSDIETGRRE